MRVESQAWESPGDPAVNAVPIAAVAELLQYSSPTKILQATAYNLFPEDQGYVWQIGAGDANGLQGGVAVIGIPSFAKRGNQPLNLTTDIAIQNLVPKPGFTDFVVYVYDQNGLLDYVCEKLNEKQVEYINLDNWGWIQPGFLGSAVISAVYWEHDVITGIPVFGSQNPQIPILLRNVVGLAAVKVERAVPVAPGAVPPGDITGTSEGFPIPPGFDFEGYIPQCPGVPTSCAPTDLLITVCAPYAGASILVQDEENPLTIFWWTWAHPGNIPQPQINPQTGTVSYYIPAASGTNFTGIGADGIISGHRYRIRIGDFQHEVPPLATNFLGTFAQEVSDGVHYWANMPGIDTVILVPCQSGAAAGVPVLPYVVNVAPPAGVIEGYESAGAPVGVGNGLPTWDGAPLNPNAGKYIALWLAPTAANQSGTFLQAVRTNTEGYFKFNNVNPCLTYELKFVSDINGTSTDFVIPDVVATVDGQKYMVYAGGIYGPGPRPLPGGPAGPDLAAINFVKVFQQGNLGNAPAVPAGDSTTLTAYNSNLGSAIGATGGSRIVYGWASLGPLPFQQNQIPLGENLTGTNTATYRQRWVGDSLLTPYGCNNVGVVVPQDQTTNTGVFGLVNSVSTCTLTNVTQGTP
ncbi:MAG: hypothetical protein U0822_14925 [Anaerolineae bacterium]